MSWDREREKKAGKAMTMAGCVYGVVFMVFWCAVVAAMRVWIFLLFGLFGLGMSIYRLYVCIQVSKEDKKKRQEETDPWDRPAIPETPRQGSSSSGGFCPYCGGSVQADFEFCPKCGRRLN